MQTDFWQCNLAVPSLCCVAGAFCCLPSPSLPPYPSSHPSIIALRTHSAMCSFLLVFVHVFFCASCAGCTFACLCTTCAFTLLVLVCSPYLSLTHPYKPIAHQQLASQPPPPPPPPSLLLASSTAAAQKLDPNLLSFWQSQSCAINPQSSQWQNSYSLGRVTYFSSALTLNSGNGMTWKSAKRAYEIITSNNNRNKKTKFVQVMLTWWNLTVICLNHAEEECHWLTSQTLCSIMAEQCVQIIHYSKLLNAEDKDESDNLATQLSLPELKRAPRSQTQSSP